MPNGAAPVSESSKVDPAFSPRNYGALGDGRSHPAGAVLGIATLDDLAHYVAPDGSHPYAWVSTYPYGTLFNLQVAADAPAGAKSISFAVTQSEGLSFHTAGPVYAGADIMAATHPPGLTTGTTVTHESLPPNTIVRGIKGTSVQLTGRANAASAQKARIVALQPSPVTPVMVTRGVAAGTDTLSIEQVPGLDMRLKDCVIGGVNIVPGTTIKGISGETLILSTGITGRIPDHHSLTIQCSYVLYLQDVAGVSQGMSVRGAGIQPGTQVDWVNPATLEVGLSHPTVAIVPGGASLTFMQPWLSKIVVGARVTSPSLSAPATVRAVDEATGRITLSTALRSVALSSTSNSAPMPRHEGTGFTFYSPFTDTQAAELQMDGLALVAAVKAAEFAGGGTVQLPAGTFLVDLTIIFPTSVDPSAHGVSLVGDGLAATTLVPVVDFGPSRYVLSCGDPTANWLNMLGIYTGGGQFCPGEWRNFSIKFQDVVTSVGNRPQRMGVPIIMGGVKQGARHNMWSVNIGGFNVGIQFQGDWTTWNYVSASNNFVGWRLDNPMPHLFGDLRFDQVFFGGNAFAGLAIAPQAGLLATKIDKSWIGDQPYDFWFEPGLPTVPPSIEQTIMDDLNLEGAGCGTIKDGNITDETQDDANNRGLSSVAINASFFAANPKSYSLPAGCPWRAYIDVEYAKDLTISSIPDNAFEAQVGGVAAIRLDGSRIARMNAGGVRLSGNLLPIMDGYGRPGVCQEVVSSRHNLSEDSSASEASIAPVEFEIPGVGHARQYRFTDEDAKTLPRGTVVEGVLIGNRFAAQSAGRAAPATTVILGETIADYAACDMNGKFVPVIQHGLRVPVRVTSQQKVGVLLKSSNENYGTASSSGPGPVIGIVVDANHESKNQVWVLIP